MPRSTLAFHNRIALVFDFDPTLAPGPIDALLRGPDVEPDRFHAERVPPLDEAGWDRLPARCPALIGLSKQQGGSITRFRLEEVGRGLKLFEGLPSALDERRDAARAIALGVEVKVEVESYAHSAGFAEIVNASAIARRCSKVWGGTFDYDGNGCVTFPKRVIACAEKERHLVALAKGLGVDGQDAPADVWCKIAEEDHHMPLDQMIYVGAGASDLPAFNLREDRGGLALAVTRGGENAKWGRQHEVHRGRRVQNPAEAGCARDSELRRPLQLGIESIAKRVAPRRLGRGE